MPDTQQSTPLPGVPYRLTADQARAFAVRHFGIDGAVSLLSGERDENFLIQNEGGAFVLKVTHPAEDRGAIAFQTRALLHIAAADPLLPTPRVVAACDGKYEVDIEDPYGEMRTLRLLGFLPGAMAASRPTSSLLRAGIGTTLARFDKALEGFSDPADTFELSWDINQAEALRPLLSDVALAADRANAERALDRFALTVVPVLHGLRRQVIHNDLTPFNILVDENDSDKITGVIDFGDMIRAPLINDLAIACAYHIGRSGDPLAPVLEIAAAYHAGNPISAVECDLIYDLMATRLAITVMLTEWNAARNPQNRAYILKNHPTAVAGLTQLGKLSREDAQIRLRRACGLDT